MKNLALIVLNYNSASDTIKCVSKLAGFHADYHIIIVDNQSNDQSFPEIRRKFDNVKGIDIIQTTHNGGYSAGNNFGIRYAIEKYKVSYIGILNPDVIIPDFEVFRRMLEVLKRNEQLAVIGASAVNANNEYNPNLSSWNIPSSRELIFEHFLLNKRRFKSRNFKLIEDRVARVECVTGSFFIGRVNALEKVGFLDENVFLYEEENILGIKLKSSGYQEAIVLDQFYVHNHRHIKNERVPLKKKLQETKNGYISRRYLCKVYYSRALLPALFFAELMNKIFLMAAYIKNKIKNKGE